MTPALVVVGAGPRGTGVLERIAANLAEVYGEHPLDVHLVDPHPPGGGRIWRRDQSPLLWMNSHAEDVTLFTDDTVEMAGPVTPGPDLAAWAAGYREGTLPPPAVTPDPELDREIRGLAPAGFASRRLQSAYLGWVHARARAALPPRVTVHEHRRAAVRVEGGPDGAQRVWLEGSDTPLTADAVLLTLGHLDTGPDAGQRELTAFAARHGLAHLLPAYTADSDLDALAPGEPVLVRGLGLAFIDLMVLVTEGRGGRWTAGGDGRLVYHPSGDEPVLYAGSRRGVPYRSKIGYGWEGEPPPLPRFLTAEVVDTLRATAGAGGVDFARDLWPLIDKELGWAHYHRLFTTRPGATRVAWADFAEKYAAAAPLSEELRTLVATAVPDPADRLDLTALDRPLAGTVHPGPAALQAALRRHIAADLDRRHDPAHSPDLAVFLGLLSVYGQLLRLGDSGQRWHGFFSHLASGPPGPRLRQLAALSEAGIVHFLGPGTEFTADEETGLFRAASPAVPGHHVEARVLVEARLPDAVAVRSTDPLPRALLRDGAATGADGLLSVDPADGRLLGPGGTPHPRRFALGPHTGARGAGAFTRPRTNSSSFRQNDATARALLTLLRGAGERGGGRGGTARTESGGPGTADADCRPGPSRRSSPAAASPLSPPRTVPS
ncbi:FAD/NAD(P)-binding protein [Streptomyces sp. NPDC058374]|uniref:FAD/NAD(P)-binding protein n=1 Tax=unclassified Streptomyces TaxID=2593676 RepID=UPI0036657C2C